MKARPSKFHKQQQAPSGYWKEYKNAFFPIKLWTWTYHTIVSLHKILNSNSNKQFCLSSTIGRVTDKPYEAIIILCAKIWTCTPKVEFWAKFEFPAFLSPSFPMSVHWPNHCWVLLSTSTRLEILCIFKLFAWIVF